MVEAYLKLSGKYMRDAEDFLLKDYFQVLEKLGKLLHRLLRL